jgi:hypothetical protein
MPPQHYAELATRSRIKAVAVVEEVTIRTETNRATGKEVLFRLERSFGEGTPRQFRGSCASVDHPWQRPMAGGTLYFYPQKGARVLITVSDNGGPITSYTPLNDELNAELTARGLTNIVFSMGRAVIGTRREGKASEEQWFTFYREGRPAGYLHITGARHPPSTGVMEFHHELLVGELDGDRQQYLITTRTRGDESLTPIGLRIKQTIISRDGSSPGLALEVHFRPGEKGVKGGILRREGEQGEAIPVPASTTTDLLLFTLVCRLPFSDAPSRLNVIETLELHLKQGVQIRYRGRDPQKGDLHRFETRGPLTATYWLNNRHELIEVRWDQDKFFRRSSEAEAQTVLQ